MGTVYRHGEPGRGLPNFKPCIAVPCFDGVTAGFAHSLMEACVEMTRQGIPFCTLIYSGNCHVDDSRNKLVRDFLDTDCSHLVFIDSDLQFDPDDLLRLLSHDRPIVGGIYPFKEDIERYVVDPIACAVKGPDGLLEVNGLGTGFLKIDRKVIEELAENSICHIDRYDSETTRKIPIIFERIVADNTRFGGDYAFCWKWRKRGGRIFADPSLKLVHIGTAQWTGIYEAWQKRQEKKGLLREIDLIKSGKETNRDITMLSEIYGNRQFAATPEIILACILMARGIKGNILECGSGLSTLAMAAANPENTIYTLEHDPIMAAHTQSLCDCYGLKNVKIIVAPLKLENGEYWYNWKPNGHRFDFVVCDGPPKRRDGIFKGAGDSINTGAKIIFDDYGTHVSDEIRKFGKDIKILGNMRKFAIVTKEAGNYVA